MEGAVMFEEIEKSVIKVLHANGTPKGMGVLVGGHYILTPTHLIRWDISPKGAILGPVPIEIGGARLEAQPVTADVRNDIAVLGEPNRDLCPDDFEKYLDACQAAKPVKLFSGKLEPGREIKAWIRTHDQGWIPAVAQRPQPESTLLYVKSEAQTHAGTSGGPVVTAEGELLGVLSHGGGTDDHGGYFSTIADPHMTLPRNICSRIVSCQDEYKALMLYVTRRHSRDIMKKCEWLKRHKPEVVKLCAPVRLAVYSWILENGTNDQKRILREFGEKYIAENPPTTEEAKKACFVSNALTVGSRREERTKSWN